MNKKIFIFVISFSFGIVLMNIFSMRNIYTLKDKDGSYAIVNLENVKSRYEKSWYGGLNNIWELKKVKLMILKNRNSGKKLNWIQYNILI